VVMKAVTIERTPQKHEVSSEAKYMMYFLNMFNRTIPFEKTMCDDSCSQHQPFSNMIHNYIIKYQNFY